MTNYACTDLIGKTVGRWKVKDNVVNVDTTSKYSLLYKVTDGNTSAIMKVLNYEILFTAPLEASVTRSEMIGKEATAFYFEERVAKKCSGHHMGNIVRYLDSGDTEISGYMTGTVSYIVYELSDGKIGDFLSFSNKSDFVADLGVLIGKLRSLHQVAKGIKQLHTKEIAHHNITPLSLEVFDSYNLTKVGGLQKSRSKQDDLHSPETFTMFDGDWTFAPPEAFFAYKLTEDMNTYYQIDSYMLGNLIVYYLTSLNMTALLNTRLPHSMKNWASMGAGFEEVLPEIINAFYMSLSDIKGAICMEELREPLCGMIEGLCFPDPSKRGYQKESGKIRPVTDMERVISKLDLLFRKAQITLYQQKKK